MRRNNNRALYEKIMRNVAKEVKKALNENNVSLTFDFTDIPVTPDLPQPILQLQELCDNNAYLELEYVKARKQRRKKTIEYKVSIGVDCNFEFYFTIKITVDPAFDGYDVYAFHTIEGLETEFCEGYVDDVEFDEQVTDFVENAGNNPNDFEEYRY